MMGFDPPAVEAQPAASATPYRPPADIGLDLLHADAALIVVSKPAGLLAVPGRGEHLRDCMAGRVAARFADARVVHRLDMATSGLMVFARGESAQRDLSRAFAQREVHKRYVAVVFGSVAADQGEIDLPLCCDWPQRPRQRVDHAAGKPSLTRWHVLARDARRQRTRLMLEPITGRSHQLRVHLSAIGHAIVGDPLYADPATHAPAPRLLLHASAITLPHPGNGTTLCFCNTPPF